MGGDKFLISNLPDLARTPFALENGTQFLLNQLVLRHNTKLLAKVDDLKIKYPEVTFVYFDIYSFFNGALEHADDYGFNNSSEPCYFGGYTGFIAKPDDKQLQSYLSKLNPRFDASN